MVSDGRRRRADLVVLARSPRHHSARRLSRPVAPPPRGRGGASIASRSNTAFEEVIRACAGVDRGPDDAGTWISEEIIESYCALHELGYAHSVEAWEGEQLVGGLYGVALGGAFFGESMFHRVTDASKVALVALVERLRERAASPCSTPSG